MCTVLDLSMKWFKEFWDPKMCTTIDVSMIRFNEIWIPRSYILGYENSLNKVAFWDPEMCTVLDVIYDMFQRIAWWWLTRIETCCYMHNLWIINKCVWLKLYILNN
jgi:hypothetical protein